MTLECLGVGLFDTTSYIDGPYYCDEDDTTNSATCLTINVLEFYSSIYQYNSQLGIVGVTVN